MKKYVLKSTIVFTMILILGLILIPMIPTEKEYVYSNGYELLIDNEIFTFDGYEGYVIDIPVNDYDLILVRVTVGAFNMSVFTNLYINTQTYLSEFDMPIIAVYQNIDNVAFISVVTGENLGDVPITVWGVSK